MRADAPTYAAVAWVSAREQTALDPACPFWRTPWLAARVAVRRLRVVAGNEPPRALAPRAGDLLRRPAQVRDDPPRAAARGALARRRGGVPAGLCVVGHGRG